MLCNKHGRGGREDVSDPHSTSTLTATSRPKECHRCEGQGVRERKVLPSPVFLRDGEVGSFFFF